MISGVLLSVLLSLLRALIFFGIIIFVSKLVKIKLRKVYKLVIISLLFVFFILTNSELYFPLCPYIDTKFTDGFSLENYRKISAGMTRSEVESLIGKEIPNHFTMIPDVESGEKSCVLYSQDRDSQDRALVDFAWIGMNVCYNSDNQVTRTHDTVVRD